MNKFDYHMPRSLEEAYGLMEELKPGARYLAGGTDLIVRMKQGAVRPESVISLRHIEDLKGIRWNGGLSVGGMTLFRDLEGDPEIAREYPALSQAVRVLANPQVRNVATIGGNLANAAPSADCAPPLLVLEAEVAVKGPAGERVVPVDRFFTGPGETCMETPEVLASVRIPPKGEGTGTAFLKAGRVSQDIAVVNAAALVVMEGGVCRKCRLAAGAVAPVPLRLRRAEEAVEGKEITPELVERVKAVAEEEVSPITDVRSTAEYRRTMSGVLIKRALYQALEAARA